jgi:hypothetical protein
MSLKCLCYESCLFVNVCIVYTLTNPFWWCIAPHLAHMMKWAHCLWVRTECHTVVLCLPEFHLKPCSTFKKEFSFIGRACTGVIWHRMGQVVGSIGHSIKKNFRSLNLLGISWAVKVVASQERIFRYLVIAVIFFLTCDVVFIWYSLCLSPHSFSLSSLVLLSFNTTPLQLTKFRNCLLIDLRSDRKLSFNSS